MAGNSAAANDWQTQCSKLNDRGAHLYVTKEWSDMEFTVGDSRTCVRAHRVVLAASSPVFAAMVYGPLAEKQAVHIPDMDPNVFNIMLKYIYTDVIHISSFEDACALSYGARKYMIPPLWDLCMSHLVKMLTPETVCKTYEFAKRTEEADLEQSCIQMIQSQTSKVLVSKDFLEASTETVELICSLEPLAIRSELELFKAVERYAQNMEEEAGMVTEALRSSLKNIRFLTVKPNKFTKLLPSRLLTDSEALAILANIVSPNAHMPMPEGFSTSRQKRNFNKTSSSSAGGQKGYYPSSSSDE